MLGHSTDTFLFKAQTFCIPICRTFWGCTSSGLICFWIERFAHQHITFVVEGHHWNLGRSDSKTTFPLPCCYRNEWNVSFLPVFLGSIALTPAVLNFHWTLTEGEKGEVTRNCSNSSANLNLGPIWVLFRFCTDWFVSQSCPKVQHQKVSEILNRQFYCYSIRKTILPHWNFFGRFLLLYTPVFVVVCLCLSFSSVYLFSPSSDQRSCSQSVNQLIMVKTWTRGMAQWWENSKRWWWWWLLVWKFIFVGFSPKMWWYFLAFLPVGNSVSFFPSGVVVSFIGWFLQILVCWLTCFFCLFVFSDGLVQAV